MNQKTIDTYNKLAQDYDEETIDFWKQFPRTFFDKFADLTKGSVLNIGSGPGRDGLILQESGLAVTCLDASKTMIKLSRQKGLESVCGDFSNLPFADNSFDGVWAYTSLLHIPKSEVSQPLTEIKRVLKPGGTFGLGLIEGKVEKYRESSGINLLRWFSFYEKDEVEDLLGSRGFQLTYFEEFKPGSKNYLNFIFINSKEDSVQSF